MNREEAESIVRNIRRTCRGLPVLSAEKRTSYFESFRAADLVKDWDTALQVCADTEHAVGIATDTSTPAGDWETLNRRFAFAVFAHADTIGKGCGADFNDIICAGDFDGKQHEYECSKCGQTGKYGAPYFEIEAAAV